MVFNLCLTAMDAAKTFATADTPTKNKMLHCIAEAINKNVKDILAANFVDLSICSEDSVFFDRLTLTKERIEQIAAGVRAIAELPDPVGEITEERPLNNGIILKKVRAPLGVIGVIYEARPNVTVDVAALCIKSGNAVVLRGGKEAINTNKCLYNIMRDALKKNKYPYEIIQFINDVTRESSLQLIKQKGIVDVIIPRGGETLKNFVLENSQVPVIASAGGICHVYVEKSADLEMAKKIVINAKTYRPSVCNAAETLLIDEKIAKKYLPEIMGGLKEQGVFFYGCEKTCKIAPYADPAEEKNYRTEYFDLHMSVKVVKDIDEAIEHINTYNTKHSDAIVTSDEKAMEKFTANVDAAAVYVNIPTCFTDGFLFGMGAEVAISTQKLHARGPLGLKELTSEKFVLKGNGQTRK